MDIIVTSGDQSTNNFTSNFVDAIRLDSEYEVAVKSIFYGPTYNITSHCNFFRVYQDTGDEETTGFIDFEIPPGFYVNTCEILEAMQQAIEGTFKSTLSFTSTRKLSLKILPKDGENFRTLGFYSGTDDDTLMNTLGQCLEDITKTLVIDVYTLENQTEICCLYSSIVENMTINQQQSHLLACFPVKSIEGYNYHEFINPMYRPLNVHAFTDIHFLFTDIKGVLLEFDKLPTVIVLNIRKA